MAMPLPSISLVIPMFNEEENIEHAIACAGETLAELGSDYEILIVDDASTDRGPERVRAAARENPRIRMVQHEKNRKLGGSLKTGFAAAQKDVVLYMDADLPFDPREIGRALSAMRVTRAHVARALQASQTQVTCVFVCR